MVDGHLPQRTDALGEALDTTVRLKRALIQYTWATFGDELLDRIGIQEIKGQRILIGDEMEIDRTVDDFIHTHRTPDGRSLIGAYVDDHQDLPELDKQILLGWQDSIIGIFVIREDRYPELSTFNEVDGLEYRVFVNTGADFLHRFQPGESFLGRIVPFLDAWLISGSINILPAEAATLVTGMAVELAQQYPELYFRNPEKLEKAREAERENHEEFVELFGSDLVVGSPEVIESKMRELCQFHNRRAMDRHPEAAVRSPELVRQASAVAAEMSLPPRLWEAETVGMLSQPEGGVCYLTEYGALLDLFSDPQRLLSDENREMLRNYLENDSVEPPAIRRAAELDVDKTNALFRRYLARPGFDWCSDGEALLREYNPGYFQRPRYPQLMMFDDRQLAAFHALSTQRPIKQGPASGVDTFGDWDPERWGLTDDEIPMRGPTSSRRKIDAGKHKQKRKQKRKSRAKNRSKK